ncbi:MAG: lysylphosphatidylglycerol synthase transmembrane domain-containing protein [Clostridia bacterium]
MDEYDEKQEDIQDASMDTNLTTDPLSTIDEPELKPTSKKVTYINFALILVIFIGLFIYMLKVDGIDNMIQVLTQVDYHWVLAGVGCLLILWLCDSICLHIPLKKLYPNQKFTTSIKVTMIGQLFNNITPFSSGGQPMQAYELTKTGKRASDSMSVLAMKFIITQIALVVFTLVVMLFQFDFFASLFKDYLWVAILGFAANIVLIVAVILAGIYPKIIIWITTPILHLLGKFKLLKHPADTIEKLNASISNFNKQFKFMHSQKTIVLKVFIWASIQSFAYYSITYMVYRAFGNQGINFWQIVPAQAFLLMIMTIMPTPGAGVGAEGGFLLIFNSIFKTGTIHMAILFWRMYTFYLPIIIGTLFLIPSHKKTIQKNIRN